MYYVSHSGAGEANWSLSRRFGSEFEETGGRGLGDKAMAEVMEVDDNSGGDVVRAFDTTISSPKRALRCRR
jgi:hypothetical protein